MLSQNDWVWNQLSRGRSLTAMQALKARGIMRLGARIYNLKRDEGWYIKSRIIKVKNRFGKVCHVAQYRLDSC